MAKYKMTHLASVGLAALMLAGAPLAAMAADDSGGSMEKSDKMKGPPNANGAKGSDANSQGGGDNNGAASAKSTGADK